MINIYGTASNLGFGIHSLSMVKALIDAGQEVNVVNLSQPQIDPYFESYWRQASNNLIKFNAKEPSLYIFHEQYSHQACGKQMATFSIFETDKLKDICTAMLNNGPTDIVLATTEDHKHILRYNGIKKPIEILHEGVDDALFNVVPATPWIDTKKFTYLTVGKKEKRKYTDTIISHFLMTMSDKEVALIAHTFNPFANKFKDNPLVNLMCWSDVNPKHYGFEYKGWDGKSHLFSKGGCDIYFTAPQLQAAEMSRIYHSANIGIQVSHGEAWNLPLIESLACGLPCIASNTLGHREYISNAPDIQKQLVIPVSGEEIAVDGIWFTGDSGNWETINSDMLDSLFEKTYNEQDKYKTKNEELSNYILNNFSWKKAANDYIELIRKYTN